MRIQSEEERQKRSASAKARWAKREEKDKQSVRLKSYFSDVTVLEQHRQRMIVANNLAAPKISVTMKRVWQNPEYRSRQMESRNLLPMQLGGKIALAYKFYPEEFQQIRLTVLARDKFRCRICHYSKREGRKIVVHHIDWNKTNNDLSNLITLCASCHKKAHNCFSNEMQSWFRYKAGGIYAL